MLKHSPAPSEELYTMTEPEESAAASRRSSHGSDLKDLDKLARNVGKFNPSVPNNQKVQAYLQDIDFHLEMRPNVMDKDKLYLLRTTSSPEVRSFLDRQPVNTKTDYQRLRKALFKEFADPESDQGLVAALETRQGRHEPPHAYYSRLRQAFFGTRNDSDMEDQLNFKTLFLRNLHPGISHRLGVLACPRTMNTQQLRDLVQKAYYKQKMASEKSVKPPAVLDFNTQHHELALEGTQRQDSAKPPHKEWNAPPSNRERDSHAGTRPKQRYDRVDVDAHLDDTGISHGTKQGLMRAHGIDRGTSQARMETPRESDKLTLEQSAQGIDERIHQDSKLTELQLNPHKNKKHHRISTHKS